MPCALFGYRASRPSCCCAASHSSTSATSCGVNLARRPPRGASLVRRGGRLGSRAFLRWKDHDAYQQAFTRRLARSESGSQLTRHYSRIRKRSPSFSRACFCFRFFPAWLARIVQCIRMRSRQETGEPSPLNVGHVMPQRKEVLCKSNRLLNPCPRRNPATNHISHNPCRLRLLAGSPRIILHQLHRHPGNPRHPLAWSASVSCSSPR